MSKSAPTDALPSRGPRRGVRLAMGSPTRTDDAVSGLLRQRLRAIGLILSTALVAFLVRSFLTGDDLWRVAVICLFAGIAGLTIFLTISPGLTLRQLRLAEFLLFGLTVALVWGRNFAAAQQGIEAVRTGGEEWLGSGVMLAVSRNTFAGFTLMVIHGLFIPCTWRQSALFTAPLALATLGFPIALRLANADLPELLPVFAYGKFSLEVGFKVFLGIVIAIYGSHTLHNLRREAADGKRVGQYMLRKKIGEGGMGEVWLADHALLARPAALKLISFNQESVSQNATEVALRRFEQEAKATSRLSSPHTIQIFDFGRTVDNSFYYVMEMLDGIDLQTLVADYGPVSESRAIQILLQVCESLAEAHEKGMVHRDIKPQNIFLCRLGLRVDFAKVLDFGLVKVQGEGADPGLTQAGVVGTPAYLPPEMATGDAVDGRTDVYALGCVAFWLLTGKFVFEARSGIEIAAHHMRSVPRRPSSATDAPISEALDRIIVNCLAKDPIVRPESAIALAERLRACDPGDWTEETANKWWDLHLPRD